MSQLEQLVDRSIEEEEAKVSEAKSRIFILV